MINLIRGIVPILGIIFAAIFGLSRARRKGASEERAQHNEQIIKKNEEEAKLKADWDDNSDSAKSDWMLDNLEKRRRKIGG